MGGGSGKRDNEWMEQKEARRTEGKNGQKVSRTERDKEDDGRWGKRKEGLLNIMKEGREKTINRRVRWLQRGCKTRSRERATVKRK